MAHITVNHWANEAFKIDVRGHLLAIDQPSVRRDERGPAPVELFVASLAGCAATAVAHYLRQRGTDHEGMRIECDWILRPGPQLTIGAIRLRVLLAVEPDVETVRGIVDAVNRSTVRATIDGGHAAISVEVYSMEEWAAVVRRQEFADAYVLA